MTARALGSSAAPRSRLIANVEVPARGSSTPASRPWQAPRSILVLCYPRPRAPPHFTRARLAPRSASAVLANPSICFTMAKIRLGAATLLWVGGLNEEARAVKARSAGVVVRSYRVAIATVPSN